MLKKNARLSRKEFSNVFRRGRAFTYQDFIVKWFSRPKAPLARFGISCGIKVSKKAVVRNRIRRQVYEIIRAYLDQFRPGDYILIIKPSIIGKSFKEIEDELLRSFSHINETMEQ